MIFGSFFFALSFLSSSVSHFQTHSGGKGVGKGWETGLGSGWVRSGLAAYRFGFSTFVFHGFRTPVDFTSSCELACYLEFNGKLLDPAGLIG